jgi:hypothetical protein
MIKSLQGFGGVQVEGVYTTGVPYLNQNPGDSFTGVIRVSGNDIQYYNSGSWSNLPVSYATVKLDQETLDAIQWARTKRNEEMMWKSLANENKAVLIALDNLEQARRQLDITAKLARDHEQV